MSDFLEVLCSDLQQAKRLPLGNPLTVGNFIRLFCISRTCRVQTYIRLRALGGMFAWFSSIRLKKRLIEIGEISIGRYLFLPHPQCVIIAGGVRIGDRVNIGQYVTIGGNFKKTRVMSDGSLQRLPIIGNRVMVLPGAVIGGPVTIGDDVIVGANSVVTKDVPSNTIVYGQNMHAARKIKILPEGGEYRVLTEDL